MFITLSLRKVNEANQLIGNWLGGEVVSNEVGQPGFNSSGYTNISTTDGIVHGQVKQSGAFSFVRIYESGHVSLIEAQICPCEARSKSGHIFWECPHLEMFLG